MIELSTEKDADGKPLYDCNQCPDRIRAARCCPYPVRTPAHFPEHPAGPNKCPVPTIPPFVLLAFQLAADRYTFKPSELDLRLFQALQYIDSTRGRALRDELDRGKSAAE